MSLEDLLREAVAQALIGVERFLYYTFQTRFCQARKDRYDQAQEEAMNKSETGLELIEVRWLEADELEREQINARANGARYDVIGVSYYPYWLDGRPTKAMDAFLDAF